MYTVCLAHFMHVPLCVYITDIMGVLARELRIVCFSAAATVRSKYRRILYERYIRGNEQTSEVPREDARCGFAAESATSRVTRVSDLDRTFPGPESLSGPRCAETGTGLPTGEHVVQDVTCSSGVHWECRDFTQKLKLGTGSYEPSSVLLFVKHEREAGRSCATGEGGPAEKRSSSFSYPVCIPR